MNVRKINKQGLHLCDLQAKTFESSINLTSVSSEIFIRRFMDNESVLQTNLHEKDFIFMIEEEYGPSKYGSVKYTHDEMFWIGYFYRYFCYTYELTSVQVYKIVKPKELRGLFLGYHSMDPAQAIERILEAKGLLFDEESELKRQFEIYKTIRKEV